MASNPGDPFVHSGQTYLLFTEVVPFSPLRAVPNIYMCLPYKWPRVESPLLPCGESWGREIPSFTAWAAAGKAVLGTSR